MSTEESLQKAAMKSDMDEDTARKYLKTGKTPEELKKPHTWQTRANPFEEYWEEIKGMLAKNPGLEAKTIFEYLQRLYPGTIRDGQLRTLQRKIKHWRIFDQTTIGPEVFFCQEHKPGMLCESDFTHMDDLGIIIAGELYRHLLYHFVLTYSNWEDGTPCHSESLESLREGLQNALWRLGAVPFAHRTDRLSAAIQKPDNKQEFTKGYEQLLKHYKIDGQKTQPASPNENGDIEQRNHRIKRAVEQQLMLRGSREFSTLDEYKEFLSGLYDQLNAGRREKVKEEQAVMHELPANRLENFRELPPVRVSPGATIRVLKNVYSINSRLIGEHVNVHLYADYLEVKYKGVRVETIPRLHGSGKHHIQYRHIIDWLVRKPGAFENYKYKQDLFPTTFFRIAYDLLMEANAEKTAVKHYLQLLYWAAKNGEDKINLILKQVIESGNPIDIGYIKQQAAITPDPAIDQPEVTPVDLKHYEELLEPEVTPCQLN
jgi:transposase